MPGTLGMVPLIFKPIYTLYSGYLLDPKGYHHFLRPSHESRFYMGFFAAFAVHTHLPKTSQGKGFRHFEYIISVYIFKYTYTMAEPASFSESILAYI